MEANEQPVWMYRSPEGEEYGPYTRLELEQYVAEDRVSLDGYLKQDEDSGWQPVGNVLSDGEGMPRLGANTVPPRAPSPGMPNSNVSKTAYILVGILPGVLVSLFGIHNLIAGYTAKGVFQLVIGLISSLALVLGLPCCLVVYPGLVIWTIIEVCTVNVDSQGRQFT